ncbi:MAG: hypothetical protein NZ898_14605 [Myxococcota bacterium]|nr:hypothetical protein [Myxococcota bacterium]MDW8362998.1 hypothetical protein [Myxococcales bacterium]
METKKKGDQGEKKDGTSEARSAGAKQARKKKAEESEPSIFDRALENLRSRLPKTGYHVIGVDTFKPIFDEDAIYVVAHYDNWRDAWEHARRRNMIADEFERYEVFGPLDEMIREYRRQQRRRREARKAREAAKSQSRKRGAPAGRAGKVTASKRRAKRSRR